MNLAKEKLIIPAKKYRGETSVVSARLPLDMIRELDRIVDRTGRNRNEVIQMCLEYALDNLAQDSNEGEG